MQKRKQSGFTLLEAVVTLMIIGFIGLGIAGMLVYGAQVYKAFTSMKAFPSNQLDVVYMIAKRESENFTYNDVADLKKRFFFDKETQNVYWAAQGESYPRVDDDHLILEGVDTWEIYTSKDVDGDKGRVFFFDIELLKDPVTGDQVKAFYQFPPKKDPA